MTRFIFSCLIFILVFTSTFKTVDAGYAVFDQAYGKDTAEFLANQVAPVSGDASVTASLETTPRTITVNQELIEKSHTISRFATLLLGGVMGLKEKQLNISTLLVDNALTNNHLFSLTREWKAGEVIGEDEELSEEIGLTLAGSGIEVLPSKRLIVQKDSQTMKALKSRLVELEHKKAEILRHGKHPNSVNKQIARLEVQIDERYEAELPYRFAQYALKYPGKIAAMVGCSLGLTAAASGALSVGAGMAVGASTNTVLEYLVNPDARAFDYGKAALVGSIPAAHLKYMLPYAGVVSATGYALNDQYLMYGGGVAAALGVAGVGVSKSVHYFSSLNRANHIVSEAFEKSGKLKAIDREIDLLGQMPKNVMHHGQEASLWNASRQSRSDGLRKLEQDPTFGQRKAATVKVGKMPENYTIPETYDTYRIVTHPNMNPGKFTSDIFDRTIDWTAPVGSKQTYKVIQRNDIDWNMVRTSGRTKGMTNLEAAKKYGTPPQLSDGYFATLHHLGQDARGGLIEASTKLHSFESGRLDNGKKYFDVLHGQHGNRVKNPEFPVDHKVFQKETAEYWKSRAEDIL